MTDQPADERDNQPDEWAFGGAADIRAMQQLASDVWRMRSDLVNVGATVGELAWIWGCNSQFGPWFKRRFWTEGSDLLAFGWMWPPYPMRVSVDRVETVPASLTWQVHPERPELMDGVLSWFDSVVPMVREIPTYGRWTMPPSRRWSETATRFSRTRRGIT